MSKHRLGQFKNRMEIHSDIHGSVMYNQEVEKTQNIHQRIDKQNMG